MDERCVILLLLSRHDDLEIITNYLSSKYVVDIFKRDKKIALENYRLIITDSVMLKKHYSVIESDKMFPGQIPVMMVYERHEVITTASLPSGNIDALIIKPIQKDELLARVEIIIRLTKKAGRDHCRVIVENSNDWIYLTDTDGSFIYVSPECESITGYSSSEFISDPQLLNRITHPDDRQLFRSHLKKVNTLEDKGEADFRIITRGNNIVWIGHKCKPVFDESGKYMGRRSTNRDITDRMKIKEELRESKLYNRMLFDQSPMGLALTSMDGHMVDVNPAYAAIIGRTIEDTQRLTYWDITPEKYYKQEQEQLALLDRTGRYGPYEKEYIHKDGHVVPVRLHGLIIEKGGKKQILSSIENIYEQKKAIANQTKSLDLLNNLAAQVPGVVFQYRLYADGHSNFPYASPGIWDIFEVTLEDVAEDASPAFARVHPNDYEHIAKIVQESAKNNTNFESEFRVVLPKQGLKWRYCSAKPQHSADGSTIWHGIITDITERRNNEEALLHSHNLMNYIIEHDKNSIAIHDKKMNYIYVSQRYIKDFRLKDGNIIGKNHYEVFPDLDNRWKKIHKRALAGEIISSDEEEFPHPDGTVYWARWECRPWYEPDGTIGGVVRYSELINERKQKELEITKLNHRLEILVESVQKLAAAQSVEEVQTIVIRSARKLIEADGATIVFRENNNCYYVDEDAISPLWKGKKFPMETCISGWVMINKQPVVIEDIFSDDRIQKNAYSPTFVKSLAMVPLIVNNPIGAIGNYWKDKHKASPQEVQLLQTLADAAARSLDNIKLYSELEDRVKERTKQLKSANRELETFTYSVSHDLKAPLRGIDGYSKLLLDEYGDSLNEEASFFIRTIRDSTLHMNLLIEDLLSYSRLERVDFKKEKIKLKPLVESLIGTHRVELEKNNFSIKLLIPDVEVITDSTGLSVALRNFIENAIKFSRVRQSPSIKITYEEKTTSWIVSVKDNGVGFDMKYHDRIFEIFQRLHRAEEFPGTGIGLAMVAKAVQRMDGNTWAESTPQKGSSFFIEIPKNNPI